MGIILTDDEHVPPYRGPIRQPCSACSAGDTAMEHHDHDYVPEKNRGREIRPAIRLSHRYTIEDITRHAMRFCDSHESTKRVWEGEAVKFRGFLWDYLCYLRGWEDGGEAGEGENVLEFKLTKENVNAEV